MDQNNVRLDKECTNDRSRNGSVVKPFIRSSILVHKFGLYSYEWDFDHPSSQTQIEKHFHCSSTWAVQCGFFHVCLGNIHHRPCLSCRFLSSPFPVCQVQGAVMTFSGLSQIAVLSSISFTRYVIITNPNFKLRACHARRILYGCYGYCLAVALCPVLGWNTYLPNEAGVSCEPVWDSNSRGDRSFNIFMIVTCFLFPLLIICVSYSKIILAVRPFFKRQLKEIIEPL